MYHPAFWLGKDCLHLQGETQAATGTSEPGPGQWVGDWVKLDLCFGSIFFCCLQSLFAGQRINHRLSLEISNCRLEKKPKPKMTCLLIWMGRIDADFCYDASTRGHSPRCLAAGLQKHGRLQQRPAAIPGEGRLAGLGTQCTSTSSPARPGTSTRCSADMQEGGEAKDNFSGIKFSPKCCLEPQEGLGKSPPHPSPAPALAPGSQYYHVALQDAKGKWFLHKACLRRVFSQCDTHTGSGKEGRRNLLYGSGHSLCKVCKSVSLALSG